MDYKGFIEEAKKSDILSKDLIAMLIEAQEYNSYHFINWATELLGIVKIRLDRGDKITDAVSGVVYDPKSFKAFVEKHFSKQIINTVYPKRGTEEKFYFKLEKSGEGEYHMVLVPDSKQKTFKWISALSDNFSLVYMIATGVVYLKNIKAGTYNPFLSDNGKYCRYDEETGKIYEI